MPFLSITFVPQVPISHQAHAVAHLHLVPLPPEVDPWREGCILHTQTDKTVELVSWSSNRHWWEDKELQATAIFLIEVPPCPNEGLSGSIQIQPTIHSAQEEFRWSHPQRQDHTKNVKEDMAQLIHDRRLCGVSSRFICRRDIGSSRDGSLSRSWCRSWRVRHMMYCSWQRRERGNLMRSCNDNWNK